ncbi:MAG: hypothetical protein PHR34_06450 [Kiritimatiellae bacterium]|nr:hypothetical protein [Kiritimatiellia bacterium]
MTRTPSMNTSASRAWRPLAAAALFALLALALAACDIGSTDSTTAIVSDNSGRIYNFSGLYVGITNNTANTEDTNNPPSVVYLVQPEGRQSGRALIWLRILQYGSVLEAYDNAGMSWDGQISSVTTEGTASFTLTGKTTAGADVEIIGSLRYASQNSTLDAAWIEPSFSGSIIARASVSSPTTNTPPSSNGEAKVISPLFLSDPSTLHARTWRTARHAPRLL